ncbi:MAG: adenosylhomocysteinase [Candidatus Thermoplasmatota archaeon]|jgi:adenosylhomocysteinase|nr:adenosylhomocysteinase [Candidatus Thermoplasmatota archaeon]MCL5789338.1 adenosylhomocysteinase [Candidatus Thermoplasmatota archaeon]
MDGKKKIEWAMNWMPVMASIRRDFLSDKPFSGMTISMALHLEAKTAVLAYSLKQGGAKVRISGCNPLSTDDEVAASLRDDFGVSVFAKRGLTREEYYENLAKTIEVDPDIIIDDGGDLTALALRDKSVYKNIKGGNEETTTGVVRLRNMEKAGALKFPMFDVNDALMKHLFDNRYGTGQSTIDGILTATNLVVAGKNVVVGGYGWCGRGIANKMRGLGANVTVTEIDPFKSIEAHMDGFLVRPMEEAIKYADFVITATGVKDIVTPALLKNAKDGIVLANSGHFNNEVAVEDIEKKFGRGKEVRRNVTQYNVGRKKVYVLSDGRLVNLASGQGHPVEIMDLSFSIQALTAQFIAENPKKDPKVYPVPEEIDLKVANTYLDSYGIKIDKLTREQLRYINSWQEGT